MQVKKKMRNDLENMKFEYKAPMGSGFESWFKHELL